MIKNEIDKDTGLETRLALKMGYKNSSPLNKFWKHEEREMDNFNGLLILVRELFPDREFEIMEEYIRTINPKHYTARICLEYTQINKLNESHKYLLDSMKNCKSAKNEEWARLYQIDFDLVKGVITPLEANDKINELSLSSPELKAFANICKYYLFYDLSLIDSMERIKPVADFNISQIDDEYLKKSYTIRLECMSSEINLHKNKISKVRDTLKIVEECDEDYHKTLLYLNLGNSYIFESYENAMKYMNKSLEIAKKHNFENRIIQAQSSITFVQNYYGYIPHYLNEESDRVSDIHEIAFFYIRQNNPKGMELLNSIDVDGLTGLQKGFNFFYKGLATNNMKHFLMSVKCFSACGEKFYKNLPLIELKRLGVDEDILDAYAF